MNAKNIRRCLVVSAVMAACLTYLKASTAADRTPAQIKKYGDPVINTKMAKWCIQQKGKVIGKGECTDMVNAALERFGREPGNFSKEPYVWGSHVIHTGGRPQGAPKSFPLGHQIPEVGQIIQFQDCVFVDGNSTWKLGAPRHTAIVLHVTGSKVNLVHQNAPIGSGVSQQTIDFYTLQSGKYYVYNALPKK